MPLPAMPDLADIEAAQHLWEQSRIHEFDPDGPGPVFSVEHAAPVRVGRPPARRPRMSYARAEFVVRYQHGGGGASSTDGLRRPRTSATSSRPTASTAPASRAPSSAGCAWTRRAEARPPTRRCGALGLSVDWRHRFSTIDDRCRRIAQASFLDLWRRGRIYRTDAPVQWDPQARISLSQADIETRPRQARLYEIAFSDEARIATTRPELLPACVALYRHPDDAVGPPRRRHGHRAAVRPRGPAAGRRRRAARLRHGAAHGLHVRRRRRRRALAPRRPAGTGLPARRRPPDRGRR